MSNITIWHNPRCTKSRQTLKLLEERGLNPVVRRYLDDAPDAGEISAVLAMLGGGAIDMMRPKEKAFAAAGLSKAMAEADLVAAMAAAPILIERPIVINGDKAAIGRPPEAVLDIL